MPRVTISIPAELKEQLGQAKVRQALNVSRVCQRALRKEVQRLLDVPTDVDRMNRLIDRLRQERQDGSKRWFLLGSSEARIWVEEHATLADLRRFGEYRHAERIQQLRQEPPAFLRQCLEDHRSKKGFERSSYLDGWAATIGPMWETIKRHL